MSEEEFKKITSLQEEASQTVAALNKEFWKNHGDSRTYLYEAKLRVLFKPLFEFLEKRGVSIGPVIFDIGAGQKPVSEYLLGEGENQRTIFAVDFLKPYNQKIHHVDTDINSILHPNSVEYKRKLIEIAHILGIDPHQKSARPIDAMIFSEVLNYVPYREVLAACIHFLKKGGVLIIYNQPGKTFAFAQDALPSYGVQNNNDLITFLSEPVLGLKTIFANADIQGYPNEEFAPVLLVFQKK